VSEPVATSEPGHSGSNHDTVFSAERPRLLGLAYRMLGSLADAEDVVQEAWLRWHRPDAATIERPAAWLTTVVTRLSLDRLRTIERRREAYVGPWLPEPVALGPGPEDTAELAESLTLGFLVLLDRLGPVERAVFLLADVFGESYRTIAVTVGRSEEACRQIASRARRRLREERSGAPSVEVSAAVVEGLVAAIATGDVHATMRLLDPGVVLVSDGGPDRHAARRPVVGPDRVARLLVNLAKRLPPDRVELDFPTINGAPAFVIREEGRVVLVLTVETAHGRIGSVRMILNQGKLGHLDDAVDLV